MKELFTSDYSQDYCRWIKKLEEKQFTVMDFSSTKSTNAILEKFQNEILLQEDVAFACLFTIEFSYKSYKMQQLILSKRNAKYALLFAQHVKDCDVAALQKIVIESKKIKFITHFACFVKGAKLKFLENLIIISKSAKYAHMYLKHVKKANLNKFKEIILASKKPRYIFELAKHISNKAEVLRIQDLIIQSGSFTYMRLFAEKIKLADVDKIEQIVLQSNNIEEIKKFAIYVKRSKMKQFLLVN